MVLFVFDRDEMAYLTCILKLAGSQLKPNSQRRTQFSSSQLRFPVELNGVELHFLLCIDRQQPSTTMMTCSFRQSTTVTDSVNVKVKEGYTRKEHRLISLSWAVS